MITKEDLYLSEAQIHKIYCVRESMLVPCFEDCGKRIADTASDHTLKQVLGFMVMKGTLCTVNGKHGIHISDTRYEALKNLAEKR